MKDRRSVAFHLACAVFVVAPVACHRPDNAQAKIEAQQRWSAARGRIKLQLARQQFDRGQFADALKSLDEVIGLDPTAVDAYALAAKANLELGRPATAEQIVSAARNAGLRSADLFYLQGVILEQRDQLEAALVEYEKARAVKPDDVDCFIAQVETLVDLGRTAEAMTLVDENADRFDDRASIAVLGARVAAVLGDIEGAVRRYQHPSVLLDRNPIAAAELADLLIRAGRCAEAVRILAPLADKASDDSLDSAPIRRALATCRLALNEPRLALAVLSDHARRHPEDRSTQLLVARAAIAAGDDLAALRALDAVRNEKKDDPTANLLLAAVLRKRGDWNGAEAALNDILLLDPYDLDAWCLMGEILRDAGRLEEAEMAFSRALIIKPELPWAKAGRSTLSSAQSPVSDSRERESEGG